MKVTNGKTAGKIDRSVRDGKFGGAYNGGLAGTPAVRCLEFSDDLCGRYIVMMDDAEMLRVARAIGRLLGQDRVISEALQEKGGW